MWFLKPNVEKLKRSQNVRGLIRALRHSNTGVRTRAKWALVGLRDKRAVRLLCQLLADPSFPDRDRQLDTAIGARVAAARILSRIGDASALDSLITALEHQFEKIRAAAADALGEIGDGRAVRALIIALEREKTGAIAQAGVAEALGRLGDRAAVKPLIRRLRDVAKGRRTRSQLQAATTELQLQAATTEWAARGVREIVAFADWVGGLDDATRAVAARALGNFHGDASVVRALIAALGDASKDVRQSAVDSLRELADPAGLEQLRLAEERGLL